MTTARKLGAKHRATLKAESREAGWQSFREPYNKTLIAAGHAPMTQAEWDAVPLSDDSPRKPRHPMRGRIFLGEGVVVRTDADGQPVFYREGQRTGRPSKRFPLDAANAAEKAASDALARWKAKGKRAAMAGRASGRSRLASGKAAAILESAERWRSKGLQPRYIAAKVAAELDAHPDYVRRTLKKSDLNKAKKPTST